MKRAERVPKTTMANYVDVALLERLRAFCNGCPPLRLSQCAIVSLALIRLLDETKDDPRNLFK